MLNTGCATPPSNMRAGFLKSVIDQRLRNGNGPKKIPSYTYRGQDTKYPSLDSGVGNAPAPAQKVYTGENMLGIATMHKSNAVPVFSAESATDISKMRR